MKKVYVSSRVRGFGELRASSGIPMLDGPVNVVVGRDGETIDGLVGFVLVFDSLEAARAYDPEAVIRAFSTEQIPEETT